MDQQGPAAEPRRHAGELPAGRDDIALRQLGRDAHRPDSGCQRRQDETVEARQPPERRIRCQERVHRPDHDRNVEVAGVVPDRAAAREPPKDRGPERGRCRRVHLRGRELEAPHDGARRIPPEAEHGCRRRGIGPDVARNGFLASEVGPGFALAVVGQVAPGSGAVRSHVG